ncbi:hypothetical protein [Blautia wexlerae]|nr:hypothetical protein [Ruminococcus sp.]RHS60537.1 hypothetical protein DW955_13875 [Ruminococcus sp. AM45-9BH]RHS72367.1 hypothetical protein DW953_14190 [Ruminococcus sp. AM45-2]
MIGAKPVLSIQKLVGRSESWKALKISTKLRSAKVIFENFWKMQ